MKIYYAAPLFNDMELKRNSEMKKWLQNKGYDVYLPQDESGLSYEMMNENNKLEINKKIFEGIKSIGFKIDTRALDYTGDDNLMIEGCMDFKIARSLEELEKMLKEI